jgi:nicotinamidase-related amidase
MKKAYLIVDMSNDFVDDQGSLSAGEKAQKIVSKILLRIEEFHRNNDLIFFCMDSHHKNDAHFNLWTPHNVKGSWGAQLFGGLNDWYQKHKEDTNVFFLEKSEYDAFYKTNLCDILKKADIETVYIAGVCTDICVFNTVYGAYKCGFKTVVANDECATFTQNHEIFLNQMNLIYKTQII